MRGVHRVGEQQHRLSTEGSLNRTGGVEIVASVRRDLTTAPKPPIVDLGSPHAPSFEKLAEARPQVIVGDRQLHGSLRDKLAVSGAEVVLVGAESVDATFDGLLEVGRRCGVEAPMAAQVDSARRAIPAFALAQRHELWQRASTADNLRVIQAAFERHHEPLPWLPEVIATLVPDT